MLRPYEKNKFVNISLIEIRRKFYGHSCFTKRESVFKTRG